MRKTVDAYLGLARVCGQKNDTKEAIRSVDQIFASQPFGTRMEALTPDPANTSYRVQTGEVRMRGLELEGKAEINDAFSVIASYAYTDSEITRDNSNASGVNNEGNRLAFVPEHQAALWLDYSVQSDDAWGGLSFGGGARYVSEQDRVIAKDADRDTSNMPSIPSYWVADMMAAYRVNKNLNLRLNVYNLFDKEYLMAVNNGGGRLALGAPRSAALTANVKF